MKKITILHANDLHNELYFKADKELVLHGGISMFTDYVKQVRSSTENIFFGICGDILQEDILGSDYKGTNTVNIINCLRPDAISLGNHELDYGLAHLLIFKECINAPVLNANIQVSCIGRELFHSSLVYETGGVKLLLIGLIPKAFFNRIASDEFCRSMVSYKDSYEALREEIQKHKDDDIDLTVIMSHYGIEGDIALAENMPSDIHPDIILGGHSHINMGKPEIVNDIIIAQSSYGTDHIGRFDIELDDNKRIYRCNWERVSITDEICSFDEELDRLADNSVINRKPVRRNLKIGTFEKEYSHRSRLYETEVGDIISDAFKEIYGAELVILQSGSIRRKAAGPDIFEKDLRELYPFDDAFLTVDISGRELLEMFGFLFSLKEDGSVMNGTFQYSRGLRLVVDGDNCFSKGCRILEFTLDGEEICPDRYYKVGVTRNCFENFRKYFNAPMEDERAVTVGTSSYNDLAHWFLSQSEPVSVKSFGRFEILNFEM